MLRYTYVCGPVFRRLLDAIQREAADRHVGPVRPHHVAWPEHDARDSGLVDSQGPVLDRVDILWVTVQGWVAQARNQTWGKASSIPLLVRSLTEVTSR